jgi:O-antigen/teichoic acid export membrane protein
MGMDADRRVAVAPGGEPEGVAALGAADLAGERAAKNTFVRALAEIVGKLASFLLFAAIARQLGDADLGVYVFAFAFLQLAMGPVDFGLDRFVLREVAKDHSAVHRLLVDVLAMKLAIAVPVLALSFLAVGLLGYTEAARETVYLLAGGIFFDSVARVLFGLFMAHERGELVAAAVIVQRIAAAGLGLAALAAGYGIVTIAATYSAASLLSLLVSLVLLVRAVARPRLVVSPRGWHRLVGASLPFGVQDIFSYMLFRADAVLLSLMATQVAVGLYGAAYRLFEATTFLSYAVSFAFQPMFSYLGKDSNPSIGSVFERSIKVALFTLVPLAVVFGVLAEPLCGAFFGSEFEEAAGALRLLAPVIVLDAVATLGGNLVASQGRPGTIIRVIAAVAALNIALNLALIPAFREEGAAGAMLLTEIAFVVAIVAIAARQVGRPHWGSMLAAPAIAGLTMAAVTVAGSASGLAVAGGILAYFGCFLVVERLVSPDDLSFVARLVRRRLPAGLRGAVAP